MFIIRWLIAFCFVISGLLFFWKPGIIKWWIKCKGLKKIKWRLFWLLLALEVYLLTCLWKYEGTISKLAIFFSMLLIIKLFSLLKKKVSQRFMVWFSTRTPRFFRIASLGYILFGVILFFI